MSPSKPNRGKKDRWPNTGLSWGSDAWGAPPPLPERVYETTQHPDGVSSSELEGMSSADQQDVMEQWFRSNFEDPVHHMPVESGEYSYPLGGPYDAADELHGEFGGTVPEDIIDELASHLASETSDWAPALDQDDDSSGDAGEPVGEEILSRAEILRRLETAEAALAKLAPQHGGIGHNNPPDGPLTAEEHREAVAAVSAIREEVQSPRPNLSRAEKALLVIGTTAAILGKWFADRLTVPIDEFNRAVARKIGEKVGDRAAEDALAAYEALKQAAAAVGPWLQSLSLPF